MSVQAVLAPLFVQVALTFALMFWMGYLRITSLRQRQTRVPDIALGERNWPPRTLQAANAFGNQFQLPVLFYVLMVLALIMHKADLIFVVLSWVFVISRILHAGIHVTTNTVSQRFTLYLVGVIVLLLMWAIFAVQIMLFV